VERLERREVLDVVGVGIGPFNLGLAALLHKTNCKYKFFERKSQFEWHPGMMIDGTTLQVPFMADMVTMVDPTNPFSYLNYLHTKKRLYQFYFLEKFHVLRSEYNHYCQWVAEQLPNLNFESTVENIEYINDRYEEAYYKILVRQKEKSCIYYSRHIVIGIGTEGSIPDLYKKIESENLYHSSNYLINKEKTLSTSSITVIGSGQSAAEIVCDLLKEKQRHNYKINWFTRSRGFFPMEYSKLGLEHFSPDYIHYFYNLHSELKKEVLSKQDLLYKGISFETINEIYDLVYELTVGGKEVPIYLQALTELRDIEVIDNKYKMLLYQLEQEKYSHLNSDVIIMATGYKQRLPHFLDGIKNDIQYDDDKHFIVDKSYKVKTNHKNSNHIYIQNGELHSHGVGAPDLGLGAYRNAVIVNQILGEEFYSVYSNNVFQKFGF
jgi:lysine N6-hydroxylase